MSVQNAFDSLNISPVFATQLMSALGLQTYELDDPVRFKRLEDIVRKISLSPDPMFLISRLTTGKQVDKLDHVWGYLELQDRLDSKMQEMRAMDERHDTLVRFATEKGTNPLDLDEYRASASQKDSLSREIGSIRTEMSIYEK